MRMHMCISSRNVARLPDHIRAFTYDCVWELFAGNGAFADRIARLRDQYLVRVQIAVPPSEERQWPIPPLIANPPETQESVERRWHDRLRDDLFELHDAMVPHACHLGNMYESAIEWRLFFLNCIEFHP